MSQHPSVKIGPRDLSDDALDRYRRTIIRRVEDGLLNVKRATKLLTVVRREQIARAWLWMQYGAIDDHLGTDSYDAYQRLNQAPTYRLAAGMDCTRAQHGRSHVLDWPVMDAAS